MGENWEVLGLNAAPGTTAQGMVKLAGVEREIPLILVHGRQEGPVTVILGGIHGCEYTSIDAAIQLSQLLRKEEVRGRVAIIPVVAVEAYATRSVYVHPFDRKNLNRNFPGNPAGTETERLAYQIHQAVLRDCDYLVDLHGGDMNEALVPFLLYAVTGDAGLDGRTHRFAEAFGLPYMVASDTPGSTYVCAAEAGKVAVLAEAGQQGILDPAMSTLLVDGTLNALRSVGVLPGEVCSFPDLVDVKDFAWTRSDRFGAWYPAVNVGEKVTPGRKMGEVRDLMGDTLREVYSSVTGTVLFSVTSLAINPGDPLFAIGVDAAN